MNSDSDYSYPHNWGGTMFSSIVLPTHQTKPPSHVYYRNNNLKINHNSVLSEENTNPVIDTSKLSGSTEELSFYGKTADDAERLFYVPSNLTDDGENTPYENITNKLNTPSSTHNNVMFNINDNQNYKYRQRLSSGFWPTQPPEFDAVLTGFKLRTQGLPINDINDISNPLIDTQLNNNAPDSPIVPMPRRYSVPYSFFNHKNAFDLSPSLFVGSKNTNIDKDTFRKPEPLNKVPLKDTPIFDDYEEIGNVFSKLSVSNTSDVVPSITSPISPIHHNAPKFHTNGIPNADTSDRRYSVDVFSMMNRYHEPSHNDDILHEEFSVGNPPWRRKSLQYVGANNHKKQQINAIVPEYYPGYVIPEINTTKNQFLPDSGFLAYPPLCVVEFKNGRIDFFCAGENCEPNVGVGDLVIVEADRGKDMGRVIASNLQSYEQINAYMGRYLGFLSKSAYEPESKSAVKKCRYISSKCMYRRATPAEISQLPLKRREENSSVQVCKMKVKKKNLLMNIIDAEYQWDRRKLTFYFTSDGRIDFRNLVRDLFKLYKTRIWMCLVLDENYLTHKSLEQSDGAS